MSVQAINNLEDLRRLRDTILALAEKYRARQVSVFGSIVRGELQTESDVDFLVDFEPDYKLRDHIRLTQALQSLVGRRVEIVDRRSLREELRATIMDDAQEL
ncbi:MAG: nucleotidyltransferase domain-containing protein [Anaerolineae bacterium]|nr:nucleotidyltransferase domain-containing protein [Anaerolineae bacterium]